MLNSKRGRAGIVGLVSLFTMSPINAKVSDDSVANSDNKTATNEIEVVTVTGNRTPTPLASSLSIQHVITAEDIQLLNPVSLTQLLASVAGIDISTTGGRGQNASVFFRGANAGHTLVLLDGVKISSATLGQSDLQKLSVNNIDRIEIIKGPRASVWGSEAISGVIQIFTKQSGRPSIELAIGQDGYQSTLLNANIKHGNGQTSVMLDREKSDGFDVLAATEPDKDGYDFQSLSVRGSQAIDQRLDLNWIVNLNSGESEYDSAFSGPNRASHNNHHWQLGGDFKWTSNITNFSLSEYQDRSKNYGNGTSKSSVESIMTKRQQLSASNSTVVNKRLNLTLGTDLITERVSGPQSYQNDERDVSGFYAQVLYNSGAWRYEGSLRYDVIEKVDSETTSTLAIGYDINSFTQVAFNRATGFRAPTFNDLYWPEDAYAKGNPDLQSERSINHEVSVKQTIAGVNWRASYFQNEISNLIEWQPNESFQYQPMNVLEAEIKGLELNLTVELWEHQHSYSATWLDAIDANTRATLPLRAEKRSHYQVSKRLNKLSYAFEIAYIGERQQKMWDGEVVKLPSHSVTNVNLNYEYNQNIRIALSVKDVFDQSKASAVGYLPQGQQAIIKARYTF